MKFYSITQNDKYKTLIDADQVGGLQDFATKLAYGETSLESDGREYRIVYNSDDEKKAAVSDFHTFFRPVLVVSEKAYAALGFLRVLPRVKISGPRFEDVALYITELLPDVFDFEKSDYDKGEGGYVVYKAVLKIPESYRGEIFRISESPQLLYVSQVFKDAVELSGLKGLNFREVERSDIGGCSD
ncbi:hypothetical protein HKK52_00135 [Pseudomonas sp. ADAK2]|uniref:hypothetical protein n=1 Tax=Pseudomonas TaxID=286 RepID=UPI00146395D3|nr:MULTISPECIES: hypothetical protein [unclassified Pseudomonas]QJI39409.1 hypothetical protein HKK53_00135 [Pseudomonas sp. ADAK7]QJI45715.1 hypothetical protein HKK52_00135 [Pseudomonas sp. ADAK2]